MTGKREKLLRTNLFCAFSKKVSNFILNWENILMVKISSWILSGYIKRWRDDMLFWWMVKSLFPRRVYDTVKILVLFLSSSSFLNSPYIILLLKWVSCAGHSIVFSWIQIIDWQKIRSVQTPSFFFDSLLIKIIK